jgi:IclR family transcriptional regulator, pca regulon regulatory protein
MSNRTNMAQASTARASSSNFVASLERGLHVIDCLLGVRTEATLAEVARSTGLSRAAARRVLLSLESLGYAESDGRYFRVRREILEIGYAYLSALPWWRSARAAAEMLARTINCECAVSVLDGEWQVSVAHASPTRFSVFDRAVGSRAPAYAGAAGRVLLAQLDEVEVDRRLATANFAPLTPFTIEDPTKLRALLADVRTNGYAAATQEIEIGYSALAVPIRDPAGRVVAALEASFPVADAATPGRTGELVRRLTDAAQGVTEALQRD